MLTVQHEAVTAIRNTWRKVVHKAAKLHEGSGKVVLTVQHKTQKLQERLGEEF